MSTETPDLPELNEQSLSRGAEAVVQDTLENFLESASVEAVYGEPIRKGDTLVIPAAEVLSGLAFGYGFGFGANQAENEAEKDRGGGGGGGGGGRVFSRPVAVVVVSAEGVEVKPVIDLTKIALAALTAGGFMLSMLARMSRPPRQED
jgi:uncharacterized spore protein YtfJ